MTFLPYRCPTFRTDHLLEPCTKMLARVKALQEFKKYVGPLERCVECKGEMLITKPLLNKSLEEGRLSTEEEAMVIHSAIPERRFPGRVDGRYGDHYEQSEEGTRMEAIIDAEVVKAMLPEVSLSTPHGKRMGYNLGKKYKKREEILPELPPKAPPKAPTLSSLKGIAPNLTGGLSSEEYIRRQRGSDYPSGARFCPTHPEALQRVDKLGRWMGICDECLSVRGKKCGEQNSERGVTAAPMTIPLNMPKWAEVKEWLAAQAEENERSLGQQIMFVLKTAWRQGI